VNVAGPVVSPVRARKVAGAMHEAPTDERGCWVMRLLEQYRGADVFRAGVRLYLERHAYKNTQTEDLWNALGEASRQPIPTVMDGWIFQPGYPLLSADRDGDQLVLRQQRFTYLPAEQGPAAAQASTQRWQVPVQVRLMAADATRVERLLLGEAETRLPLPP